MMYMKTNNYSCMVRIIRLELLEENEVKMQYLINVQ